MPAVTVCSSEKGAADGEDPIANLGSVGVAEFDSRQRRLWCRYLDDGDVGLGVDADDGCGDAPERRVPSSGSPASLT